MVKRTGLRIVGTIHTPSSSQYGGAKPNRHMLSSPGAPGHFPHQGFVHWFCILTNGYFLLWISSTCRSFNSLFWWVETFLKELDAFSKQTKQTYTHPKILHVILVHNFLKHRASLENYNRACDDWSRKKRKEAKDQTWRLTTCYYLLNTTERLTPDLLTQWMLSRHLLLHWLIKQK